jgi:hypothetical protein
MGMSEGDNHEGRGDGGGEGLGDGVGMASCSGDRKSGGISNWNGGSGGDVWRSGSCDAWFSSGTCVASLIFSGATCS